jgi:hypothetical protein
MDSLTPIEQLNGIQGIPSAQYCSMEIVNSGTFSFSNASLTGLLDLAGVLGRESFESAIVAELRVLA